MRAVQYLAPGRAEVVEVPLPEPLAHEVRTRVTAVTTCPHWDLHLMSGEPMFPGGELVYPYPVGQPGHEMTGVVDAVGAEVHDLRPGMRVAAWRDAGHGRPGCYAEYVCHDAEHLLPVPDELSDTQVASLELAMCVAAAVLALRRIESLEGETAGVGGLGPAGLIAAQLLRAEGAARVIGLEPNPARRDHAVIAGIVDQAVDPSDDGLPTRRGRQAELAVAVDCCGLPGALRHLMDRCGRAVALFAVQRDEYAYATGHAGLHVVGYEGHYRAAAEYALAQIVAGRLDLRPLVTVELGFEAYSQGVERLRRQEAIKVCLRPGGGE